jgi:hypothetical protein
MKKQERNLKKVIKRRINIKLMSDNKKNIRRTSSERQKLRLSKGPPPKAFPVDLVSRTAIRNGTFKHKIVNDNVNTFQLILKKINEGKPFCFSRFGDADYMMMDSENINKTVGASNKMIVTEELNREIIESHQIKNSDYLLGTVLYPDEGNTLYNYNLFLNRMYKKFLSYNICYDNMVSAVALTETYMNNILLFSRLVHEFNKTTTMFVGSYYHKNLDEIYGKVLVKIKTPARNSYSDVDRIYGEIVDNIDRVDKIIFSCGQTARIIIKRLWKAGYKKTLIDVGSLSDYFVLNTRLGNEIQLRGHIKKNIEIIKNNHKKLREIMTEDLSMFGGWAIDIECYQKILEILPAGKTILEFGSGHATNKLAETYKMYSVEHDPAWVGKYNSTYIHAPITVEASQDPAINWYSVEALKKGLPEHYDLILVDGPVGALTPNRMTRDGFRRNINLFNLDDVIIIFDDIQRQWEMNSMNMLVKELGRRVEIFNSGMDRKNSKKFGVIYPHK